MASLRAKAAVVIFSCSAGIMYSTLFTMPYLLVAHYHATGMVILTYSFVNENMSLWIQLFI